MNEAARTYREGQFEEAEEHARKALELDPENKTAPMFIARTIHAQYRPGVNSRPRILPRPSRQSRHISKILRTDPTNEEAYKAIAYLYGAIKEDDKLRAVDHGARQRRDVEPEKRAEAYIVLASKDWDCSFKITELPTNKITTVN